MSRAKKLSREGPGASLNYTENERTVSALACKQNEDQADMKLVINQSNNGSMDRPHIGDVGE